MKQSTNKQKYTTVYDLLVFLIKQQAYFKAFGKFCDQT